MCVLAFAWKAHPRWRLVLAGNRDELHARPAEPLSRWGDHPHVLGGRDLQSGGSWLGVSDQGRLAVVTNISNYGPPAPGRPSRGDLVGDFLIGEGRFAALTTAQARPFNPFNLILVEGERAALWRNRPGPEARPLEPGVYGLSNGDADDPWPKTRQLMDGLSDCLEQDWDDPRALLAPLGDDTPLGDAGDERSAVFVRNPVYGTRCSTVVAVDARGRGSIIERRFDPRGGQVGETALSFAWSL